MPMSKTTSNFLKLLYEGLNSENEEESSIIYQKYLNQCKLDFSLTSLANLDQLLLALKKQQPMQIEQLDDVKYNRFFLFIMVYVGEVFSRAIGQAVYWFEQKEIKNINDFFIKPRPASLWFFQDKAENDLLIVNEDLVNKSTSYLVLYSRDKKKLNFENIEFFLPFKIVINMLFGDQSYTLYEYVVRNLKAIGVSKPKDIDPLPLQFVSLIDDLTDQLNLLKPYQRYYLQIRKPLWVKANTEDVFFKQLKALSLLYKEAKVVWASLVQANQSMFFPRDNNKYSSLGEIIYDPTGWTSYKALEGYAQKLADLIENKVTEGDQLSHATRLRDGQDTISGAEYPKSLSKLPLKVSSILFWRKHLPNGLLSLNSFPILITNEQEGVVTVLPARFWPQSFVDKWLEAARLEFNGNDRNIQPKLFEMESQGIPPWRGGNSVNPDDFHKEDLFPKITDVFTDHIYPTEEISIGSIGNDSSRVNLRDNSSFEEKQTERAVNAVLTNVVDEKKLSEKNLMKATMQVEMEMSAFRKQMNSHQTFNLKIMIGIVMIVVLFVLIFI